MGRTQPWEQQGDAAPSRGDGKYEGPEKEKAKPPRKLF